MLKYPLHQVTELFSWNGALLVLKNMNELYVQRIDD